MRILPVNWLACHCCRPSSLAVCWCCSQPVRHAHSLTHSLTPSLTCNDSYHALDHLRECSRRQQHCHHCSAGRCSFDSAKFSVVQHCGLCSRSDGCNIHRDSIAINHRLAPTQLNESTRLVITHARKYIEHEQHANNLSLAVFCFFFRSVCRSCSGWCCGTVVTRRTGTATLRQSDQPVCGLPVVSVVIMTVYQCSNWSYRSSAPTPIACGGVA